VKIQSNKKYRDRLFKRYCREFEQIFNNTPEVISYAPGRINIIGEHTDYNNGYVLPAAINRKNYFIISAREDNNVCIWADRFKKKHEFSIQDISFSEGSGWANYVKAVFWVLVEEGYEVKGVNGWISGDIPLEAGLSSSAALEVSILCGLNALFDLKFEPENIARLAQKAENDFVGVKCGLMDQFISVFGKKDRAIFLDCESLEFESFPVLFSQNNLGIFVYDSQVKRKLEKSQYNTRREEASTAIKILIKYGLKSTKEASLDILEKAKEELGDRLFRRARHILRENNRVKAAVQTLIHNDFNRLGDLLFDSHKSLRDDYQVSCPELDLLYDYGKGFPYCLGARLTGAGFGGSGIILVQKDKFNDFQKGILKEVKKNGFCEPVFHDIEIGEGAAALKVTDRR
jgi:galactokinase